MQPQEWALREWFELQKAFVESVLAGDSRQESASGSLQQPQLLSECLPWPLRPRVPSPSRTTRHRVESYALAIQAEGRVEAGLIGMMVALESVALDMVEDERSAKANRHGLLRVPHTSGE